MIFIALLVYIFLLGKFIFYFYKFCERKPCNWGFDNNIVEVYFDLRTKS